MRHFSQNWGWTAVAPIIGSNAFNVLFGGVYDAHTVRILSTFVDFIKLLIPLKIGRIGPFDPEETDASEVIGMMDSIKRGGIALPDDGSHECTYLSSP